MRLGDLDTGAGLLTMDEVASRTGYSRETVKAYVSRGKLAAPTVRVSGVPLWDEGLFPDPELGCPCCGRPYPCRTCPECKGDGDRQTCNCEDGKVPG